ncbi:hypothetical protein ACWD01_23900 [Streptomyces sp. NPDC002835]
MKPVLAVLGARPAVRAAAVTRAAAPVETPARATPGVRAGLGT